MEPQSILTMPILPGIDGVQKMSKSLGNYVGVDDPPEEMFGKLMRVPDDAMPVYYEPAARRGPAAPTRATPSATWPTRSTARYHGEEAAARGSRSASTPCTCATSCPTTSRSSPSARTTGRCHLPALMAEAFGLSRSEARRLLAQGGVKLDGTDLDESRLDVPADELDGVVLQVGKRRFKRLRKR